MGILVGPTSWLRSGTTSVPILAYPTEVSPLGILVGPTSWLRSGTTSVSILAYPAEVSPWESSRGHSLFSFAACLHFSRGPPQGTLGSTRWLNQWLKVLPLCVTLGYHR